MSIPIRRVLCPHKPIWNSLERYREPTKQTNRLREQSSSNWPFSQMSLKSWLLPLADSLVNILLTILFGYCVFKLLMEFLQNQIPASLSKFKCVNSLFCSFQFCKQACLSQNVPNTSCTWPVLISNLLPYLWSSIGSQKILSCQMNDVKVTSYNSSGLRFWSTQLLLWGVAESGGWSHVQS